VLKKIRAFSAKPHFQTADEKHPINLLKLADYLEGKPKHRALREVLGHIKRQQRIAVESEPLCRRRSLG